MKYAKVTATLGFVAFCLATQVGSLGVAKADDSILNVETSSLKQHKKRCIKKAFRLGVCVGEALAKEGITLPPRDSTHDLTREAGQTSTWDESTRAAFKAAVKGCRHHSRKFGDEKLESNDSSDVESESLD